MAQGNHKKLMKMGELVQKTGVRKATIHFYINKGLLPKPRKTERNMAYYDESYIERIRLIKELQTRWFLPLSVIKQVISRADGTLSAAELNAVQIGGRYLLQSEERRQKHEPRTLEELSDSAGLTEEDILEMERCEIISPGKDEHGRKRYEDIDIGIVEAFASIRKVGFTKERGFEVEGFRIHSDLIGMLAIEEVKDLSRELGAQSLHDPEYLQRIAQNGLESINTYMSHLHRKKLLETVHAFVENGAGALKHRGENKTKGRGKTLRRASMKRKSSRDGENS